MIDKVDIVERSHKILWSKKSFFGQKSNALCQGFQFSSNEKLTGIRTRIVGIEGEEADHKATHHLYAPEWVTYVHYFVRLSFSSIHLNCEVLWYFVLFLKRGAAPGPFWVYFRSFQKTVGFSGIQTRYVREEGEHADHLTTTTALNILFILLGQNFKWINRAMRSCRRTWVIFSKRDLR